MGSFHQGHSRFGNVRNKQCGAISLTAVLKSKTKNVWTWDTGDLDDVLIKGTGLYRSMSAQGRIQDSVARRGYIAVSELPKQQRMWNCNFAINFAESYTGFVNVDDYDHALHDVAMAVLAVVLHQKAWMPFDEALQRALFGNHACLLTVCASTCAIVNEGGRFAFVDSHASTKVNQQGERASCVAYVSSVQYLVSFVYDYARSFHMRTPSFEVTGVKVVRDGSTGTRAQMTEPSSSYVTTTNTTNSRPLYSEVVKGEQKVCKRQFALGEMTNVPTAARNVCTTTASSIKTRSRMTEPSSSHVTTTNTTNSRPLYSEVVKGEQKVCKQQFALGEMTNVPTAARNVCTTTASSIKTRSRMTEPSSSHVILTNTTHSRPLYSQVVKGEGKFGKQQSSVGGPTKVARNVNIVNNKTASSVNVNADPNVNRCLDATDDVIVSNVTIAKQPFKPLTRQDRDDLCKKLGLSNENADKDQMIAAVDDMGCPCKIKSIKPDGNCFYHMSVMTEEKHLKIRRAVVRHLQNSGKFDKYLRNEYTSVQDYVTKSRIYYCGSWATEIDIFAAADLLQTTIFTLNDGKWNMHKPTTLSQSCLENCIYLNHTGNHYEVVTCVKPTDERRSCAGICRPMKSDDKLRSQLKRKLICESENVHAKKERLRYHSNIDYKKRKLQTLKDKYKDVCIKQGKCESSRKHFENQYRSNPQFQKYKLAYFQNKYRTNAKYQKLKRDGSKRRYGNNLSVQTQVREYSKGKYNTNKTFQSDVRDYSKDKYKTNTKFQTLVGSYSKHKYKTNTKFQTLVRSYSKDKYKINSKFQTLVRSYSKDKYKTNTKFQTLVRSYSKDKYKTNTKFQTLVRSYSKDKYKTNTKFQTLVRSYSKDKYKTNTKFQTLVRSYSKDKYKTNTKFQTLVRSYSKDKYKTNMQFQTLVRDYSRLKYKNISFQNKIKKDNKTKYRNNKNIRVNKIKQGRESYAKWQKKQEDVNCAIAHFREEVSCGPEYVCSVCHRLLFRKQVVECKTVL
ncbi:hypothetical protein N1851_027395 [Merluccius polli]|uniref:OTU domain-containing protein n=1 Tax=Merluccius polli TaxID=89951 RepID=A0AA47MA91_MERPO|nr:hypothetical protein N1851_027395 [Merluccius polli]